MLQLQAALENGYGVARSAEFMGKPLIHLLDWMGVPGDTGFAVGALLNAWFVFRLWAAPRQLQIHEAGTKRPTDAGSAASRGLVMVIWHPGSGC